MTVCFCSSVCYYNERCSRPVSSPSAAAKARGLPLHPLADTFDNRITARWRCGGRPMRQFTRRPWAALAHKRTRPPESTFAPSRLFGHARRSGATPQSRIPFAGRTCGASPIYFAAGTSATAMFIARQSRHGARRCSGPPRWGSTADRASRRGGGSRRRKSPESALLIRHADIHPRWG